MGPKARFVTVFSVVVAVLLGLAVGPSAPRLARASSPAPGTTDTSAAVYTYSNCRVGVASWPTDHNQFNIVESLNAGWHLDFYVRTVPSGPPEAEYVQMIRVSQDRGGSDVCGPEYGYTTFPALTDASLGNLVALNPGTLWIVGNEPDRVGQDGVCPQQLAQAYHDAYYFIKSRDSTAQVAPAGLVEFTPMRAQYLNIVWDTYVARYGEPMPADAWTMHLYILSETNNGDAWWALGTDPALAMVYSDICSDPSTFCHAEHDTMSLVIEQVVRMRTWMKDHGQRNKPLLVTEYSLIKPYNFYGLCSATECIPEDPEGCFCDETDRTFHPGRVADFVTASFDYLFSATDATLGYELDNNRLVQQWLWYLLASTDPYQLGHASRLAIYDDNYALTQPGLVWQQYVRAMPPEINLFALPPAEPIVVSTLGPLPATATVHITAMNNGNTALAQPVDVTFYKDVNLTQPIGTATLTVLGGCARRTAQVDVRWSNLAPGDHTFWAKLDSSGALAETDEGDNVASGVVHVEAGYGALLPAICLE